MKKLALAVLTVGLMASCGGSKDNDASDNEMNANESQTTQWDSDNDGDMDRLSEEIDIVEIPESDENATESEEATASADDADFDQYLKDYEGLLDEYIAAIKKAANGDVTALANMASYVTKLQNLEKSMKAIKNASPEQLAKASKLYAKLAEKMLEAANATTTSTKDALKNIEGAADALKNLGF